MTDFAAPSAETPAEQTAPAFLDAYSEVYAFTLLWTLAVVLASGPFAWSTPAPDNPGLMLLPPFLGVASLLFTEGLTAPKRLLARSLLLGVLGLAGSVGVIFIAALGLGAVSSLITQDNIPLLTYVAAGLVALLSLPLLLAAYRETRSRRRGRWVRILVLVAAFGALAAVVVLSPASSHVLGNTLRKGQTSFLIGAVVWYLPAFGLSVASLRSLVTG